MAIKKHVFITANGALLPRWVEAFPDAVAIAPEQQSTSQQPDVIWLRLQESLPIAPQIQQLVDTRALIVLSDTPGDDEALKVFAMGARAYANSHAGAQTLQQIAQVVEQGGMWIGAALMQRMMAGMQRLPATAAHNLTGRELEVAQAIAGGASNKEVARRLNITERTVKAHVTGLFVKLGVQDRLQLALKMRDISG